MSGRWGYASTVKPMAADEREMTPTEIWDAVCGAFMLPGNPSHNDAGGLSLPTARPQPDGSGNP